jgi:hypothetical protein
MFYAIPTVTTKKKSVKYAQKKKGYQDMSPQKTQLR